MSIPHIEAMCICEAIEQTKNALGTRVTITSDGMAWWDLGCSTRVGQALPQRCPASDWHSTVRVPLPNGRRVGTQAARLNHGRYGNVVSLIGADVYPAEQRQWLRGRTTAASKL
jgi:hypothetical protein